MSVVILDTTEQVRARRRLALLNKAGMRIGSTLDVGRTAEELAELAVEDFADFVTVDLLSEVVAGDEARSVLHRDSINFHRAAQCSVLEGCPESVVAVGDTHAYEPDSVVGRTLIKGSLRAWFSTTRRCAAGPRSNPHGRRACVTTGSIR